MRHFFSDAHILIFAAVGAFSRTRMAIPSKYPLVASAWCMVGILVLVSLQTAIKEPLISLR